MSLTNLQHSSSAAQWKRVGIKAHHGINLPLSSLHTQNSCGIGEFLDLLPLIDWCESIGMDVIQLLPINDSGHDPSPYNASSSCALNPLYLSLHALPYLEEYPHLREELATFLPLNALPRVDYGEVLKKKMAWLRVYFEKTSASHIKSPAFLKFVTDNPWVEPYALFKTLRERFQYDSWFEWPVELRSPETKEYTLLIKEEWEELCFYVLLQHLCYLQMRTVYEHAGENGVLLMGDIPILISPDSVDVWHEPHLFDLTLQAGAPPDFYIPEGQNWGFPLFKWDEMKKDHYAWWKRRLSWASNFYNLYRIDHAVGFFRIWGVPKGETPREGQFVPEDEALWGPLGKHLLEMMLNSAPMLPIAEDLGTIPPVTHTILGELGICGTKVLRWEKDKDKNSSFIPLQDYPEVSLTTVSTHDTETLSLWWRDTPEEAKAYARFKNWNYTPELTREQRRQILWDSHHTKSLFHVNLLQEYLAAFPELVWPNPEEERINIPGKVLPSNWTYRFRPSVEEIAGHADFARFMREIHA